MSSLTSWIWIGLHESSIYELNERMHDILWHINYTDADAGISKP